MRILRILTKVITTIITLIILSITIPVLLMYKNVTPSKYIEQEDVNIKSIIDEELEKLFLSNNGKKEVAVTFDEDFINAQIYETVVKTLESNLTSNPNYVANFEDKVFLQGVWVTFSKNVISLNIGAHIKISGITYKTRLLVSIKLVRTSTTEIVFKISKLSLGNMPFKWVVRVGPEIFRLVTNQTINDILKENLGEIVTFNDKRQEFVINVKSFIEQNIQDSVMMTGLLDALSFENFFNINVLKEDDKYIVKISLNVNPILIDKDHFKLSDEDKIKSDSELEEMMQSKLLTSVLRQSIQFNSIEITALLDYLLLNSLGDSDYIVQSVLYLDYEIKVLKPYFEVNKSAKLNFPILIGKEENYLKSNISLDIKFIKQNNDLKLNFSNVTLGSITIDNETLKLLLTYLNIEELELDGSSFIIKDFFLLLNPVEDENDNINELPIKITHINITDGNVSINFEKGKPLEILDDILTEFPDVELGDIASKLYDKLKNDEDINEEDLDELLDVFDKLTDEDKDKLGDILKDYLDQFGDMFGQNYNLGNTNKNIEIGGRIYE